MGLILQHDGGFPDLQPSHIGADAAAETSSERTCEVNRMNAGELRQLRHGRRTMELRRQQIPDAGKPGGRTRLRQADVVQDRQYFQDRAFNHERRRIVTSRNLGAQSIGQGRNGVVGPMPAFVKGPDRRLQRLDVFGADLDRQEFGMDRVVNLLVVLALGKTI